MSKYYAVCDANGPISVLLDGDTLDEALEAFEVLDGRAQIDAASTDAEDYLGFCGDGMSPYEFADALTERGLTRVKSPDVRGEWEIWAE